MCLRSGLMHLCSNWRYWCICACRIGACDSGCWIRIVLGCSKCCTETVQCVSETWVMESSTCLFNGVNWMGNVFWTYDTMSIGMYLWGISHLQSLLASSWWTIQTHETKLRIKIPLHGSQEIISVNQVCTNPWHQVAVTIKFCMVAPNICWSSLWYFMLPFRHLEFWGDS